MTDVLNLLLCLGKIEWSRCVGTYNPGMVPIPPMVAWRFQTPKDEIESAIVAAVETYRGAVKWTIFKGDRNWVIEPAALAAFVRNFRVDANAFERFGLEFPSETAAATDDIPNLVNHLRTVLKVGN